MTRIWYGSQRHGLNIPFPIRTLYHFNGPKSNADPMPQMLAQNTARSPIIHELLDGNLLDELAQGAKLQHFGRDEQAIAQGELNDCLYVVLSGKATLTVSRENRQEDVMQLERGDFFGAMALLSSQPSPVSAIATEDLTVLTLTSAMMHRLVEQKPSLALEISQAIEMRQRAIGQIESYNSATEDAFLMLGAE